MPHKRQDKDRKRRRFPCLQEKAMNVKETTTNKTLKFLQTLKHLQTIREKLTTKYEKR